jgi:hypothetical protein
MAAASASASTSQVRIVARIRPVLGSENTNDVVVNAEANSVSMPNPKNEKETFTFPFHAVYGMDSDQAQIFAEGMFFFYAAHSGGKKRAGLMRGGGKL